MCESGKPELMKKMNTALLYRALIAFGSSTRAELAAETRISLTTVRALLEELLDCGEIVVTELDVSSGGRRAQRYALHPQRNWILSFYVDGCNILYCVRSLDGACHEAGVYPTGGNLEESAARFLREALEKWPLAAVGAGVPGVVENGRFLSDGGRDIGGQLQTFCKRPVALENDLNAAAVGFCLRQSGQTPGGSLEPADMAYLHFNCSCTGAGIVSGGQILHGTHRFAGELGFLPMENATLDTALQSAGTMHQKMEYIARAISMLCCVTNPSLVVVGGTLFSDTPPDVSELLRLTGQYLAAPMLPEIVFSDNFREDYLLGLHHLTVEALIPLLPLRTES